MTCFEFPVTERSRTLLRLERLSQRLDYFTSKEHEFDHHAALLVLFEIMEAASRSELKSELLQELERQKQLAEAQSGDEASERLLEDIESLTQRLLDRHCRFGQHLRENEWLMAIKQRDVMPGGACQFDLPSYHYWLQQGGDSRRLDFERWTSPMLPMFDAVSLLLRLLRATGKSHAYQAKKGMFQQMSGGKQVQLIRVSYDGGLNVVPEVSANKYALNIRFVDAGNGSAKVKQSVLDIDFNLIACKF